VPSCLYVTLYDRALTTLGATQRIDPGVAESHLPGLEHVRVVAGADGFYVLWRQAPELWVARFRSSS
jgi:hypothetical protein